MADGSVTIGVNLDAKSAITSIQQLKSKLQSVGSSVKSTFQGEQFQSAFAKLKSTGTAALNSVGSAAKTAAKAGLVAAGSAATTCAASIVGVGKAALDSYAKYEQMVGGVDKLFGTGSASTVEEYAESLGKSVSEVQGEFDKLTAASQTVQDNAAQAFKTAGMSANDYMENVNGISASLINSLGGDTTKAAAQADVAMRAISDNANTFGTDINNIVQTYQSLARGNYAMLDNLKLGYGGTKTELQRLIKDANSYAKTHKDVAQEVGANNELQADSFSDVVTAIELIQRKQNIAGTTAREAATTIEGSVLSMQSAWSNWLTELGKDDADMETLTSELVESIVTAAGNIIPRLATILATAGTTLATALPNLGTMLQEKMAESNIDPSAMFSQITEALTTCVTGIQTAMAGIDWQGVLTSAITAIQSIAGAVDWMGLLTTIMSTISGLLGSIDWGEATTGLLEGIGNAFSSIDWAATLSGALQGIFNAVTSIITSIASFIQANGSTILAAVLATIVSLVATIVSNAPSYLTALGSVVNAAIDSVISLVTGAASTVFSAAVSVGSSIVDGVKNGITSLATTVGSYIIKAVNAVSSKVGSFTKAAGKVAKSLVNGIVNGLSGIASSVGNAVKAGVNAVTSMAGQFLSAGGKLISSVANGISQGASKVSSFVKNAISSAKSAALGIISGFVSVGSNIINGIVSGVTGAASKIADAVTTAANNALQAAKNALGIKSPSRVFRDEVGVYIPAGIAKGIEKASKQAENASAKSTKKVLKAAKAELKSLKKYVKKHGGDVSKATAAYWLEIATKAKNGSNVQKTAFKNMKAAAKDYGDGLQYKIVSEYYDKIAAKADKTADKAKKGSKARKKALKEEKAAYKSSIAQAKKYADTLNLGDEREYWEGKVKLYKEAGEAGKEYYKEAKEQLKDTKQQIKEAAAEAKENLFGVKEATTSSLADIKSNLEDTISSLQDTYKQAVESTKSSIESSLGFFTEFTSEGTGSIETLIGNMRTQADAATRYANVVASLQNKLGDDATGFFSYLTDAGISSLTDLETINNATAEELDTLLALYKEREEQAGKAAATINADAYQTMVDGITDAQNEALASAKESWKAYKETMKELGKSVSDAVKAQYKENLEEINNLGSEGLTLAESLKDSFENVFSSDIVAQTEQYAQFTTSALEAAEKAAEEAEDATESVTETVKTGTTLITQTVEKAMSNQYSAVASATSAMESQVASTVSRIQSMMATISAAQSSANATAASTSSTLSSLNLQTASVNWHANGGVFNKPSVIGIGEAGVEAAIPLQGQQMQPFAQAIGQNMNMDEAIGSLIKALPSIIKNSTPNSMSVNKREFARLVREV